MNTIHRIVRTLVLTAALLVAALPAAALAQAPATYEHHERLDHALPKAPAAPFVTYEHHERLDRALPKAPATPIGVYEHHERLDQPVAQPDPAPILTAPGPFQVDPLWLAPAAFVGMLLGAGAMYATTRARPVG
jgi:hypothetical protein